MNFYKKTPVTLTTHVVVTGVIYEVLTYICKKSRKKVPVTFTIHEKATGTYSFLLDILQCHIHRDTLNPSVVNE
jgi:hypothetical protein